MEFLKQNIEVNGLMIFIGIIIGVILLFTLISYIIHLSRKVKNLETPKFGFLGKPLYPVLIVFALSVSLLFVNYYQSQVDVVNIEAQKKINFDIQLKYLSAEMDNRLVELSLVPEIDEITWGTSETETFEIYWQVIGPTNVSFLELGKNKNNVSAFQINLKKGDYEIKTKVIYEDKTYEYSENITLQ